MTKQMLNNRKASSAATVEAQFEKSTIGKEISMNNHTTESQKTQTNSEFSTFKFDECEIRTLAISGEPWFIAADVCQAIGLTQTTNALRNLDEDEVALISIKGISKGNDQVNLVSESGMYTLILRCRDAVKKGSVPHRFRKWVTAEVLPQIRKTGSYTKSTTDERTGLRQAVSALVSKKGLIYSDAYSLIHQRFNVEHIDELTSEQVGMAVEYVHKIYLEGELIIDEPKEEPKLDKETALDLVSSWFALYNSLDLLAQVYRPLELLGSRHGVIAYTHVTEYRNNLSLMKRFLEPMFEGVMLDPFRQAHYFKALKTLREYEPRGFSLATI